MVWQIAMWKAISVVFCMCLLHSTFSFHLTHRIRSTADHEYHKHSRVKQNSTESYQNHEEQVAFSDVKRINNVFSKADEPTNNETVLPYAKFNMVNLTNNRINVSSTLDNNPAIKEVVDDKSSAIIQQQNVKLENISLNKKNENEFIYMAKLINNSYVLRKTTFPTRLTVDNDKKLQIEEPPTAPEFNKYPPTKNLKLHTILTANEHRITENRNLSSQNTHKRKRDIKHNVLKNTVSKRTKSLHWKLNRNSSYSKKWQSYKNTSNLLNHRRTKRVKESIKKTTNYEYDQESLETALFELNTYKIKADGEEYIGPYREKFSNTNNLPNNAASMYKKGGYRLGMNDSKYSEYNYTTHKSESKQLNFSTNKYNTLDIVPRDVGKIVLSVNKRISNTNTLFKTLKKYDTRKFANYVDNDKSTPTLKLYQTNVNIAKFSNYLENLNLSIFNEENKKKIVEKAEKIYDSVKNDYEIENTSVMFKEHLSLEEELTTAENSVNNNIVSAIFLTASKKKSLTVNRNKKSNLDQIMKESDVVGIETLSHIKRFVQSDHNTTVDWTHIPRTSRKLCNQSDTTAYRGSVYINTKLLCYVRNLHGINDDILDKACNELKNMKYISQMETWFTQIEGISKNSFSIEPYIGSTKIVIGFFNIIDSANYIVMKYRIKVLSEYPYIYDNIRGRNQDWLNKLLYNIQNFGVWSVVEGHGDNEVVLHFQPVRKSLPVKIHVFQLPKIRITSTEHNKETSIQFEYDNSYSYDSDWVASLISNINIFSSWSITATFRNVRSAKLDVNYNRPYQVIAYFIAEPTYYGQTKAKIHKVFQEISFEDYITPYKNTYFYKNLMEYDKSWILGLNNNIKSHGSWKTLLINDGTSKLVNFKFRLEKDVFNETALNKNEVFAFIEREDLGVKHSEDVTEHKNREDFDGKHSEFVTEHRNYDSDFFTDVSFQNPTQFPENPITSHEEFKRFLFALKSTPTIENLETTSTFPETLMMETTGTKFVMDTDIIFKEIIVATTFMESEHTHPYLKTETNLNSLVIQKTSRTTSIMITTTYDNTDTTTYLTTTYYVMTTSPYIKATTLTNIITTPNATTTSPDVTTRTYESTVIPSVTNTSKIIEAKTIETNEVSTVTYSNETIEAKTTQPTEIPTINYTYEITEAKSLQTIEAPNTTKVQTSTITDIVVDPYHGHKHAIVQSALASRFRKTVTTKKTIKETPLEIPITSTNTEFNTQRYTKNMNEVNISTKNEVQTKPKSNPTKSTLNSQYAQLLNEKPQPVTEHKNYEMPLYNTSKLMSYNEVSTSIISVTYNENDFMFDADDDDDAVDVPLEAKMAHVFELMVSLAVIPIFIFAFAAAIFWNNMTKYPKEWTTLGYIKEIYLYPVKSLPPLRLTTAQLSPSQIRLRLGWILDRSFLIVKLDDKNKFASARDYPELSKVQLSLCEQCLLLHHHEVDEDVILDRSVLNTNSAQMDGRLNYAVLYDTKVPIVYAGEKAEQWISRLLCRHNGSFSIAYMKHPPTSKFNRRFSLLSEKTPLWKKAPLKIMSYPKNCDECTFMRNFRPSIILDENAIFREEGAFFLTGNTIIQALDYQRSPENDAIYFGLYCLILVTPECILEVNDKICVGYQRGIPDPCRSTAQHLRLRPTPCRNENLIIRPTCDSKRTLPNSPKPAPINLITRNNPYGINTITISPTLSPCKTFGSGTSESAVIVDLLSPCRTPSKSPCMSPVKSPCVTPAKIPNKNPCSTSSILKTAKSQCRSPCVSILKCAVKSTSSTRCRVKSPALRRCRSPAISPSIRSRSSNSSHEARSSKRRKSPCIKSSLRKATSRTPSVKRSSFRKCPSVSHTVSSSSTSINSRKR